MLVCLYTLLSLSGLYAEKKGEREGEADRWKEVGREGIYVDHKSIHMRC